MNVSDPARTIIDILDEPSMGGGIRHVSDILVTYLEREQGLNEAGKRAIQRSNAFLSNGNRWPLDEAHI